LFDKLLQEVIIKIVIMYNPLFKFIMLT